MKCFANRTQDWLDVRGIVVRQGVSRLDWGYVFNHLKPLCEIKEEPQIIMRLEALRAEIEG